MSLRDLRFKTSYHKGWDDIADRFYLPCMRASKRYDRAVGYFSSSILLLAWDALDVFVMSDGRIRIICSHILSEADTEAIRRGTLARDCVQENLRAQIIEMLQDDEMKDPAKLLGLLIRDGIVDLRVAVLGSGEDRSLGGLFHSKLGVFMDDQGERVVFKGSMNETWKGLANDGNLETVDVFVSWAGGREQERVSRECEYFETLWSNRMPGAEVLRFPEALAKELIKHADAETWDDVLRAIRGRHGKLNPDSPRIALRPHQETALRVWEANDGRGIIEYATGSGKTFIALAALRESLQRGEVCIIVVPSIGLLDQWDSEIRWFLADLKPLILRCGGGSVKWRSDNLLRASTRESSSQSAVILATLQTASTPGFLNDVCQGPHIMLVVDEVHRAGSPNASRLLSMQSGRRLGLSATPKRAGDPDGTSKLLFYFDGILPCSYTLRDGIEDGVLTPYFYYPHQTRLSQTESEEWLDLSRRIARALAKMGGSAEEETLPDAIKLLSIQRARIAKSAESKVPLCHEILTKYYERGQRWIVYCDSADQAGAVNHVLREAGLPSQEYHSQMSGDRKTTLERFGEVGGILVAIRCLDEGIDVPLATHALILASSRNPREFIQRRGRLLRRAPEKLFAHIHDVLVMPETCADIEQGSMRSLEHAELARAYEFALDAINTDCAHRIAALGALAGIDIDRVKDIGYENGD